MKKLLWIAVLLFAPRAWANTCSTTFPLTQNPLTSSDNCTWIEGGTTGLDWNNMQTTSHFAGGVGPATTQYSDPTAILSGAWGPDQTAQATVHVLSATSSYYQEVELRLRSSISAHSITGYELNYAVSGSHSYLQIVRWNGALANFTYLGSSCNYPSVCGQVNGISVGNGDVVKGVISGTTISAYINGALRAQTADSTFSSGAPGIGVDYGCDGTYANFGFSDFSASDGGGGGNPPVINSSLTSVGTVGASYSYQITASNSPTSFNATGLPAGLSVNTGTGLISGTPATAGTSNVTLSATNAAGTGSATLALTVYSVCDLNHDKSTNVADVQLEVTAALGVTACTPAYDINKDTICNVVDVQRIVNAALGRPCVAGP